MVGDPACGMNAAVRAFVRFSISHGFKILGVQDGFNGLLANTVSESVTTRSSLDWGRFAVRLRGKY
jgi:6-phosphofructokinase